MHLRYIYKHASKHVTSNAHVGGKVVGGEAAGGVGDGDRGAAAGRCWWAGVGGGFGGFLQTGGGGAG